MNKFIHIPKEFDCRGSKDKYINISHIVCVERGIEFITLHLDDGEYENFDIKAWKYFAEALGDNKTEGEILG